jgi:hypothetical protein
MANHPVPEPVEGFWELQKFCWFLLQLPGLDSTEFVEGSKGLLFILTDPVPEPVEGVEGFWE